MPFGGGSSGGTFNGGTIMNGLNVDTSGIRIQSVSGEALHIEAGTGDSINVLSGATVQFVLDRFGFVQAIAGLAVGDDDYLYILNTTVPADGNLGNGSMALWLDATPGVGNTKLMIKAKDSGGTVRTGAVVLA